MAAKINLRTGKIIGAEPGTFAFYHEKGHLAYDNSEEGIENGSKQNNAMYLAFLFLAFGQFWWAFTIPALLSVLVIFYYYIYEEYWCNNYAKDMLKLKRKKK